MSAFNNGTSQTQEVRPGLFFDNDIENINDMNKSCNKITSYHVDKDSHLYHIPHNIYLDEMVKKGNVYAKAIDYISENSITETSPIFGINNTEIDIINKWIDETAHLPDRFVVFDWDNTLSLTTGFPDITGEDVWFTTKIKKLVFTPSDKISYLFGDDDRLNNIKAVIKSLFDNNITVYILTRNPVAYDRKFHFVHMLKELDARFNDNSLIYVYPSDKKSLSLIELNKCRELSGGKRKSKRILKKRSKNRKTKNKRISYKRKS